MISFRQRSRGGTYGPGGLDIYVNGVDRWELLRSLQVAIEVLHEWPELLPQILGLSDPHQQNDDRDDDEKVIPLFARRGR